MTALPAPIRVTTRTSQMMLLPIRSVSPSIRLESFSRLFTGYPSIDKQTIHSSKT
ncbi:MAG: hypothetical protein AW09_003789 [Candidatus Accumulibacter phosphatis]|uniref:Uncharacterized protein n=1 Tax=Candidatus Accumulibacter phosphatis TaxID=327160 RepID=A0A080LS21_9PROT|nr:MAG: hypothetical protein AW09_003789 [Candidatus Accumulibacter phosphatis]